MWQQHSQAPAIPPQYLLSKGANAAGADGNAALTGAARRGDVALCKLLIERGADVKGGDRAGLTPLHQAAASNQPAIVRLLLDHGADPSAVNSFGGKVRHGEVALKNLTPLMLAAPYGDVSVAKMLIDAGADINARDMRGMTALMMALASEHQNKPVVELLIARGADVNAKSLVNETALDWARKYRYRSTESFLQKARAQGTAPSKPQVSFSPAGSNAQAASRGIAVLQKGTVEFFKQSGCYGCHHQTAAAMASRSAAEAGLSYNPEILKEDARAAQAFSSEFLPLILQGIDLPGSADSAVFILTGLDAAGSAPSTMIDALSSYVAGSQRSNGSWWIDLGIARAPIEEGNFRTTARAVLALKRYGWPARQAEFTARIDRARLWLLTAKPQTSYEAAERLLGLKWAGASPADLKRAATHLTAQQRPDGGWAQNSNLKSDAYATGLALLSLYEAGTLVPSDASYRKGTTFLRKTQCADGSWYVASRSPKFQPYFESGSLMAMTNGFRPWPQPTR